MPEVLGLDVSVEMDGTKLPEYKSEVSYDPVLGVAVTTCWIPSEAGKEFSVNIVPPPAPRPMHWSFGLTLDGTTPMLRGGAVLKNAPVPVRRLAEEVVSANITRPFQFGTIQLTDDDSALHAASSQLGEIGLLIHSVDDYVPSRQPIAFQTAQGSGPVHEKSKKALAHCVQFGQARYSGTVTNWMTPFGKKLQAKVVFKYRNLDVLIAEEIAPRKKEIERSSPVAGPSNPKKRKAAGPPAKVEVIDIDEEIEKEEREARANRKMNGTNKRVKTEVKAEPGLALTPGEVIDLTDD